MDDTNCLRNIVGVLYLVIILMQCVSTITFEENIDITDSIIDERPQVEVRSVFIKCEPVASEQDEITAPDSEATRFEREELFKHSVLHDCNKKLALTVKITSEPDIHIRQSSGDEYLPIEHVFEGSNKKRIRLLDPYILRLRREPPLQAYKLRRVDTISGILVDSQGRPISENFKRIRSRIERDTGHKTEQHDWTVDDAVREQTYSVTQLGTQPQQTSLSNPNSALHESKSCVKKRNVCANALNSTLNKRNKRSELNIVVEEATDDSKPWDPKDNFYGISDAEKDEIRTDNYEEPHRRSAVSPNHKKEASRKPDTKPQSSSEEKVRQKKTFRSKFRLTNSKDGVFKSGKNKNSDKLKSNSLTSRSKVIKESKGFGDKVGEIDDYNNDESSSSQEKDYAVYEIGIPELWYTVHVQLFEKLSTADGKTVWNDLTKGEQASVSSMAPEWTGQDLNVRYRPAEWIPREEFSLPTTSLCLLAPIRGANIDTFTDNNTSYDLSEDAGYIVVPEEDIMGLKYEDMDLDKRNDNNSELDFNLKREEPKNQGRRRVVVRTSRALLGGGGTEDRVNIAFQGSDKYLTLPHKRPHHAQIDLEARADDNELVRVGATGRIAIAVADNTRKTRTIITLQIGNTGLAAARFRVVTRDCGPALSDLMDEKGKPVTMAGPMLIPPRHTRSLRLELPVEIPIDIAHCSVTLLNDDEKSIAVRDVAIRKGDRCFCVWHCDCVCLRDDPKLICREMAESRQLAAGLSTHDRARHARSACYEDVVSINVFVIFTGVLIALLLLGLVKAVLGLIFRCIGIWGLDLLVETPRKIDRYYESSLKCRNVEYDCDGYPVHPDTRERTVRLISIPMEFMLNIIFFVVVPCIVIYDAIKQMMSRCNSANSKNTCKTSTKGNTKKCFSTHDMQALALRWRRRRSGLRRWMTPQAQELSKELWKEGLTPVKREPMRPLLRDGRTEGMSTEPRELEHDSCVDSEQDDTDYVLTQMQKSRESLSILKQKSKS